MKEKGISFQSGGPAVYVSSPRESAKTVTLFRDGVARQRLRKILAYQAMRKNRCHANGTITSIVRLDEWVASAVYFLVERGKRGRYRQIQ